MDMLNDKTDMVLIYDKTDTDMINDKTDTELVYDKTGTELRVGELILDGTDTEALETDFSFGTDKIGDRIIRNNRSPSNDSREHRSPHAHASDGTDTEATLETDVSFRTDKFAERKTVINTSRADMRGLPDRKSLVHESDRIKTHDDFSRASFASDSEKSVKSVRNSEREDSEKRTRDSAGLNYNKSPNRKAAVSPDNESDGVKTEDDFSFDSFDGSEEEDLGEVDPKAQDVIDSDHSSSSYITAEPVADPSLEDLPRERFARDDASSDASVRRSKQLFNKLISKKGKSLRTEQESDRDDLLSSSADTDSSIMDSWNKAMGISSIALPPSLLSSSRKSPISARKIYSDNEETFNHATDALAKTGSFMTYEQFSKQFTEEAESEDEPPCRKENASESTSNSTAESHRDSPSKNEHVYFSEEDEVPSKNTKARYDVFEPSADSDEGSASASLAEGHLGDLLSKNKYEVFSEEDEESSKNAQNRFDLSKLSSEEDSPNTRYRRDSPLDSEEEKVPSKIAYDVSEPSSDEEEDSAPTCNAAENHGERPVFHNASGAHSEPSSDSDKDLVPMKHTPAENRKVISPSSNEDLVPTTETQINPIKTGGSPKANDIYSAPTPNTPAETPTAAADVNSRNPKKKYKRSISSKILDLQKECGFFRTPPPSLSTVAMKTQDSAPPPSKFVHVPIPTPTRDRPRGPPRRPPTRR
eukprot:Phypoly_transcript_03350.p1 GENE.Phypoly_transcript_03350~~Phypoly_transcript_03350.p1  ORF type:complete len:775 (+),score=158.10 Phypoly_transcript_03350:222-2327(+)